MARTSPTAFTHLISHLEISRFRKKNPGNINELPFREKPCFDRERESASEENQRVAEMWAALSLQAGHGGIEVIHHELVGTRDIIAVQPRLAVAVGAGCYQPVQHTGE